MTTRRVFAALCASAFLLIGATPRETRAQTEPLAKITSSDSSLRSEGVAELVRQRKDVIRGLIRILEEAEGSPSEENRGAVISAIQALGEMRAMEAVDILLHYIDFPASNRPISHGLRPLGEVYPAVGALIKIGNPSLPAVIEGLKLSSEGDDVVMYNCGWIISQVLPPGLTKSYLEMTLTAERDPIKQERVRSLLQTLTR